MLSTEDKQTFLNAADYIENHHTKGMFVATNSAGEPQPEQGVCLHGALRNELGLYESTELDILDEQVKLAHASRLADQLGNILPECDGLCLDPEGGQGFHQRGRVYHYNDYHCDGGPEAAAWLRKAAKDL